MKTPHEILRLTGRSDKGFTGWILPSGRLLACAPAESHLDAALAHGESHPDSKGWIHCDASTPDPLDRAPTPRQVDAMADMVLAAGRVLPEWVLAWQ